MTDHLSPLDAAFLDLEDEEPEVSLAISSVAVLEGPPPTHEEFLAAIRSRLPLVPRYRQKLKELPFDLGSPLWVDDPAFDLEYHVRRERLVAPGDDAALCARIADIMSQRLDRDRPLWEYWVLEGLAGGRWALVSKVHHCMVDGVSGTHLYYVVFDESPEGSGPMPPDDWRPVPAPSTLSLLGGALRDLALNPVEQVRMVGRALREPKETARRVAETARGLAGLAGALWPAVASTLTGPIGRQRRYAVARAALPEALEARKRAGVSLNDLVLAAIAGGFRTLLLGRGEEPDPHAVRTLVPVSVRARGEEGIYENRISLMLAFLPVHLADPVERLRAVHDHLAELKAGMEAQAGEAMTALARHEPFPPVNWGVRLAAHLPQRNVITVTTNVPGPRKPLYLLGRRTLEILPYVPIATRLRTGVSIFTYCDQLTFGVTGDYDHVPEVPELAEAIAAELRALIAAYKPPEPPEPPQPSQPAESSQPAEPPEAAEPPRPARRAPAKPRRTPAPRRRPQPTG
ncbi:wax ester/triacylglycerol synthase family O-acyltransferase [Actinomadura sp. ATCC 31491]|uniref:Diacylglycerol O-acyltransferase n=1 Tax=Actinomadura luzonensis TaxID=2805427 RepID=A0ABT0FU85_9ACTN|nr:wax ester/triacylglycerol synthase family O-acyltransferase [Actinomadura luzonensis]MCK2215897.1 wax ester/triacylglycerol synthase family O-acyltransferase [Actinomadura luzonensis]